MRHQYYFIQFTHNFTTCLVGFTGEMVKNLPAMCETRGRSLGWEVPPEKGMATPVFLTAEFYRHRSLVGYSPQDCK